MASFGDTLIRTEVLSSVISANINSDVDFVLGTPTNSFLSRGFNRIGDGNATSAFNKPGDQSLVMVPGLGPPASNGGPTQTHAVLKGSPATDHGAMSGYPGTDQRGKCRPQSGDGKRTSRGATSGLSRGRPCARRGLYRLRRVMCNESRPAGLPGDAAVGRGSR